MKRYYKRVCDCCNEPYFGGSKKEAMEVLVEVYGRKPSKGYGFLCNECAVKVYQNAEAVRNGRKELWPNVMFTVGNV